MYMHMYVYMYMYVYMCVYVCRFVYVYIYAHMCLSVRFFVQLRYEHPKNHRPVEGRRMDGLEWEIPGDFCDASTDIDRQDT